MATPKIKSSFFDSFSPVDDDEEVKIPVEEKEETEEQEEETEDGDTTGDTDSDGTTEQDGESDEVEDTDFFTTIINDQAEKGRLFYDEDKEYEGSGEEIFDEVITDTLNKKWQEEYLDSIPDEYHSIFEHLRQGKPLDEWVEAVKPANYDAIDITDETNQKDLIAEHLALTGMDDEDVKDTVKEYEDSGTLEKNAKKAVKYLKANEDKKAKRYEEQLERDRELAEEREERELEKFRTRVLTKDKLGKLELDKKEREKLLDHITKPVNKKGESQLVINQKDEEKQLLFAYLDMKGFDFSQLEKQVESKVNKGLRAKLSNTTDVNAGRRGESGRVSTPSKKLPSGPWSGSLNDDE